MTNRQKTALVTLIIVLDAILIYFVLSKGTGYQWTCIKGIKPDPQPAYRLAVEHRTAEEPTTHPGEQLAAAPKEQPIPSHNISSKYQYFPLSQANKERIEMIQQRRKEAVQAVCSNKSRSSVTRETRNTVTGNLLVDDKRKFILCYMPKIASTSWRVKMAAANSSDIPDAVMIRWGFMKQMHRFGIRQLKEYSHKQIKERLDSYYKFVFIRHPLERALSAYRCLFEEREDNLKTRQRWSWWTNVFRRAVKHSNRSQPLSFEEFVRFAISATTNTALRNEHWARYNRLCNFCSINYDFVGKFESLTDDISYVLRKLYSREEDYWFPKISNPRSAAQLVEKYFSKLPRNLIPKMYAAFKDDFTMFNYTIDEYMKY